MPSSGHGEGTDCRSSPKLQYLGRFCQNPSAQEIACGLLSQDERTTKSESCEWRGGWEGAEVRCVISGDVISSTKMGIERAQDLTV